MDGQQSIRKKSLQVRNAQLRFAAKYGLSRQILDSHAESERFLSAEKADAHLSKINKLCFDNYHRIFTEERDFYFFLDDWIRSQSSDLAFVAVNVGVLVSQPSFFLDNPSILKDQMPRFLCLATLCLSHGIKCHAEAGEYLVVLW